MHTYTRGIIFRISITLEKKFETPIHEKGFNATKWVNNKITTKDRTVKGTNNLAHRIGKKYHLIKSIKFYWKQICITHITTSDGLKYKICPWSWETKKPSLKLWKQLLNIFICLIGQQQVKKQGSSCCVCWKSVANHHFEIFHCLWCLSMLQKPLD